MREFYLTVGELKRWIKEHKIPDDAKVFYQRIGDVYFKKHGWETIEKDWDADIKSEYILTFGPRKYKDDPNLYIDAHY